MAIKLPGYSYYRTLKNCSIFGTGSLLLPVSLEATPPPQFLPVHTLSCGFFLLLDPLYLGLLGISKAICQICLSLPSPGHWQDCTSWLLCGNGATSLVLGNELWVEFLMLVTSRRDHLTANERLSGVLFFPSTWQWQHVRWWLGLGVTSHPNCPKWTCNMSNKL